jgi:hypothetical protein
MHFQPMPVGPEPAPDLGILMVRGIVLDQNCPLTAVASGSLFQETEIRGGIENSFLAVVEPCAPEFDSSENFHVLALAGDRNFRWATHAAPGSVQRGILPEASFVSEDQGPVPGLRFF